MQGQSKHWTVMGAAFALLTLGACGSDQPGLGRTNEIPVTHPPPPEAVVKGDGGTPAEAPKLTQGEAVRLLSLCLTTEVEEAKIAQTRGTASVQPFAAQMITDHAPANRALVAAAGSARVVPAESTLSQQIAATFKQDQDILNSLSGSSFDKAYLDLQVSMHAVMLGLGPTVIRPALTSPGLKTEYGKLIATTQTHLTSVLALQSQASTVQAGPTPPPAGRFVVPMSDAEISGLLVTFESAQVASARTLAQEGEVPGPVASYSPEFLSDAANNQTRTNDVITSTPLAVAPSPLSVTLEDHVAFQGAALSGRSAFGAFSPFSAFQVADDGRMLFWEDSLLIPQAQSPVVKSELTNFRAAVQDMLGKAAGLQSSLSRSVR